MFRELMKRVNYKVALDALNYEDLTGKKLDSGVTSD